MGCSQSAQVESVHQVSDVLQKKPIVSLIGSTIKGSMIINFYQTLIQSQKCYFSLPKYSNVLLENSLVGYMTGGIEDLQTSVGVTASIEDQVYQGNISNNFYKINVPKVLQDPQSAFQPLPDMINTRYAHCSVLLNSRLYVLGGRQYGDDQSGLLSACERYNISSQKWQSIAPMRNPRSGASAIIYEEQIYVFGGYTGNGKRSRSIESYIEGDKGWKQLHYNLHSGLEGASIIQNPLSKSSIFIFGGRTDFGRCNSVWQLNFADQSIKSCKSMKQARSFHKAIYHKGKAYLVGGGSESIQIYDLKQQVSEIDKQLSYLEHCSTKDLNSFSQLKPQIELVYSKKVYSSPSFKNKVYIFGHSLQAFAKIIDTDKLTVVSLPQSLEHNFYQFQTTIKVNKENCFIIGGINSNFTDISSKVYSFNIFNEEIKVLEDMKTPRYGFSAVVKGSFLYVLGGRKLGTDDVAILNLCERFSFETYKWENIAPLKYKRHSSVAIVYGNHLMVIGGYKGNGVRSNQIEIYNESENKWIQAEYKFQLAVESMTSVTFSNSIYLFGGRAEQIDIQKVFKLHITIDEGNKMSRQVKMQLQPMGNLSKSGTNLKVFVNPSGVAYVFGNIQHGIDVYDLRSHKVIQIQKLTEFQELRESLFQPYTVVF